MTRARSPLLRHLTHVLLGPGTVTIIVPALIFALAGARPLALPRPAELTAIGLGVLLVIAGLAMLAWTISLFHRVGQGTLSPLDPPSALVVTGPYRHVRNPMFTGVLAVLLGEAAITRSPALLAWFALFWTMLAILIPLIEEPKLARRFGADYARYRRHVPRWLPRLHPWQPPTHR